MQAESEAFTAAVRELLGNRAAATSDRFSAQDALMKPGILHRLTALRIAAGAAGTQQARQVL